MKTNTILVNTLAELSTNDARVSQLLGLIEPNNNKNPLESSERAELRKLLAEYLVAEYEVKEMEAKSTAFILYRDRLWEVNGAV